jgi:hypothetical protein
VSLNVASKTLSDLSLSVFFPFFGTELLFLRELDSHSLIVGVEIFHRIFAVICLIEIQKARA